MNITIRVLLFGFITFSSFHCYSQEIRNSVVGDKLSQIEAKIQEWKKQTSAPGVSVALQYDDFYYQNAWGFADIENQSKKIQQTIYKPLGTM